MRTTKNVSVREMWYGFAVYNNGVVVARTGYSKDARNMAFAIAKVEGKGVRMETDYHHDRYTAKQVQERCEEVII